MAENLSDHLGEQDEKIRYEEHELRDAVTGFDMKLLVPKGCTGGVRVYFAGENVTLAQAKRDLGEKALQGSWQKNRDAVVIVIGKDASNSSGKYVPLKQSGALSSIVASARSKVGESKTHRVVLEAASRGSQALQFVFESNDPALQNVVAVNSYDATYNSYKWDEAKVDGLIARGVAFNMVYIPGNEYEGVQANAIKNRNPGRENVRVIAQDRGDKSYEEKHEEIPSLFAAQFNGAPGSAVPAPRYAENAFLAATGTSFEQTALSLAGISLKSAGDFAQSHLNTLSDLMPVVSPSPYIAFKGDSFQINFPNKKISDANRLKNLIPADITVVTNVRNKEGKLMCRHAKRAENGKFYSTKTGKYVPVFDGYTGTVVRTPKPKDEPQLPNS